MQLDGWLVIGENSLFFFMIFCLNYRVEVSGEEGVGSVVGSGGREVGSV